VISRGKKREIFGLYWRGESPHHYSPKNPFSSAVVFFQKNKEKKRERKK